MVPLDRVVRRVLEGASGRDNRYVIGIAGPPGAGKSTLADALREAFGSAHGGRIAEIAPMNGYHLSNTELCTRGDLARKGEPDTFDVAGYVENLGRLRHTRIGEPVPWPTFDRRIEEPTPAGVVFTRQRVVITEGNYLLCDGAWSGCAIYSTSGGTWTRTARCWNVGCCAGICGAGGPATPRAPRSATAICATPI